MIKRLILLGSLAVAFSAASTAAFADSVTWNLQVCPSVNNCMPDTMGTVTIADNSNGGVDVTVSLPIGGFAENSQGPTFGFNLDPAIVPPTATIDNATFSGPGVADVDAAVTAPPLGSGPSVGPTGNQGSFNVQIDCNNGCGDNIYNTLTFSINGITVADNAFVPSTDPNTGTYGPWMFDANTTANALVWAQGVGTPSPQQNPATPEPSTLLFLGTGITALGGVIRRRLSR